MKVTIKNNTGVVDTEINQDSFYPYIADYISKLTPPDEINIDTPYGSAKFLMIKRSGAFFVKEEYNNISIPDAGPCKPIYLVCVNPTHNNYKCATRS